MSDILSNKDISKEFKIHKKVSIMKIWSQTIQIFVQCQWQRSSVNSIIHFVLYSVNRSMCVCVCVCGYDLNRLVYFSHPIVSFAPKQYLSHFSWHLLLYNNIFYTCLGTFESRILEYREEMQETPTMKQNVKEMGRRVKNFFLTSGNIKSGMLGADVSFDVYWFLCYKCWTPRKG